MLYYKNGKPYERDLDFYLDECIHIHFGDPNIDEVNVLNEKFDIIINDDKSNKVDIYVRTKKECSYASNDAKHWASVKARAVGDDGKRSNIIVPYLVPKEDEKCSIGVDKEQYDKYERFDSKYGKMIRTFVDYSKKDLIDYWNAITEEEEEIAEKKIRDRYDRHVANKSKKKK